MVLELSDVHTYYGSSHVLHGVSLGVEDGEVVCLLGRNGAGKTTTMRSIIGLTRAASGGIRFGGHDLTALPPHRIARLGVGFVPEDRRIYGDLTVEENLLVVARPGDGHTAAWTLERVYELFPVLRRLARNKGQHMSGGEQQMLTIARTLMGNPSALLLDEPSEGLAPIIVQRVGDLLRRLRDMGVTVLLAEQNMHFCLGIATGATVIDKGQIVYCDTIERLRSNDDVKQRYLAL